MFTDLYDKDLGNCRAEARRTRGKEFLIKNCLNSAISASLR